MTVATIVTNIGKSKVSTCCRTCGSLKPTAPTARKRPLNQLELSCREVTNKRNSAPKDGSATANTICVGVLAHHREIRNPRQIGTTPIVRNSVGPETVYGRHPVAAPSMTATGHLNLVAGVGTCSRIACMVSRRTSLLRHAGPSVIESNREARPALPCSGLVRR